MRDHSAVEASQHKTTSNIETLMDNHERFLSFLSRRVGNRSEAEEILQNAFVKTVEKSDSIRSGETIVAWFYRLLRNAVIDYYRHRGSEQRALERLASLPSGVQLPQSEFEVAVCQCVHRLMPTLKTDYNAILRRIDLEGASIGDVAKELGITANNTRVKLHRARLALRKLLELSCRTCAAHGCLDCNCNPSPDVGRVSV